MLGNPIKGKVSSLPRERASPTSSRIRSPRPRKYFRDGKPLASTTERLTVSSSVATASPVDRHLHHLDGVVYFIPPRGEVRLISCANFCALSLPRTPPTQSSEDRPPGSLSLLRSRKLHPTYIGCALYMVPFRRGQ